MLCEQLNPGACRTYLVGDEKSREVMLVDPHLDYLDTYLELITKRRLHVTHVIDTHTHADHLSGAFLLSQKTGCEYLMHRASPVKTISTPVNDGEKITIGDQSVTFLHTPGHSTDSISILLPNSILTGDTLFLDDGGAGRDDIFSGNPDEHWESLQRLGSLDENLIVLPAHEYRGRMPSSLKVQKVTNPHLNYTSKKTYFDFSMSLPRSTPEWMRPIVETNIEGATAASMSAPAAVNPCEVYTENETDFLLPAQMFISPKDFRQLQSTKTALTIVDVREQNEQEGILGRLAGSINVPLSTLQQRFTELASFREKLIIIICQNQQRSKLAAKILLEKGFTDLKVLEGGLQILQTENSGLYGAEPENNRINIYLDHAATTYLDPAVKQAMEPWWENMYGNPSSLHRHGRIASHALHTARQNVAELIDAQPSEIIFTAGGTESINLAIFGIIRPALTTGACHIITTTIEHSAVLMSCEALEKQGCSVTYLPVDRYGKIRAIDILEAIRPDTALISVMYANNEIGTIEPIEEIGNALKVVNQKRNEKRLPPVIFHTDACQAAGALNVSVKKLNVDLMTLNGSKIYGPKQTGILYCRSGINLEPIMYGGGQERALRSGTENIPGIVGFATALSLAVQNRDEENKRLQKLRDYVFEQIRLEIPGAVVNGPRDTMEEVQRLPNNINISFKGINGEKLLAYLDEHGIYASTGSACSAKSHGVSHVLSAINCPSENIAGSLRLTLGKKNTLNDMDYLLKILKEGIILQQKI